jgi:amino acid adenylation domain-containing protein
VDYNNSIFQTDILLTVQHEANDLASVETLSYLVGQLDMAVYHDLPISCSTIVELLRWRSEHTPNQIAYTFLRDGEKEEIDLTYGELDQKASAIASYLTEMMASEKCALLIYPPGLDYIAAFFGCLYANVVAVPIYPPHLNRSLLRLHTIVNDSQAAMALTTSGILTSIQSQLTKSTPLGDLFWIATDQPGIGQLSDWSPSDIQADNLAFLQYTSGSTATPRGVMLSHSNLLHNLELVHRFFKTTPESRGVIWLPPYHDMGLIGGILQPLYVGFPVTLLSPVAFLQRPYRWLQAISHYHATCSGGPNFAYDLCVQTITPEERNTLDLSNWKVAFNGAEPIRAETLERFATAFADTGFKREAFYPCYGLAEATLIVTGGEVDEHPLVRAFNRHALERNHAVEADVEQPDALRFVSSGKIFADQKLVIVDPTAKSLCPPGQVGEIWISSASIARGYWNRPDETESTFHGVLSDTDEGTFLRTGDLGFVEKGELFVTGRSKDMIIIRGRNHYPQDIETTVESCHPALRPGCGAAFSIDLDGSEQLVIVHEIDRNFRHTDIEPIVAAMRQVVAQQHELQVYAIALIRQGRLPKTTSGKIQRHECKNQFLNGQLALIGQSTLEPTDTFTNTSVFDRDTLLMSTTEEQLTVVKAYLLAETARFLGVAPAYINQEQSFWSLGLDSLKAIQLQHHIETDIGIVLPVAHLLQVADIGQLASNIVTEVNRTDKATRFVIDYVQQDPSEEIFPLSYGQQSLWFLHQLSPESSAYHIMGAVHIPARVEAEALRRIFQQLVDRHPALRTGIEMQNSSPFQHIHPSIDVDFHAEDATEWDDEYLYQRLNTEAHHPFDLERGTLLRARLFTRGDCEHYLLLVIHHLVADLWSLAIIIREFRSLYQSLQTGTTIDFAPLSLHYGEYARQQRLLINGDEGEQLWAYWQQQLSGELPILNLPTDRPRPPIQTYNGAVVVRNFGSELLRKLNTFGRSHRTTLYTVLLAAYQVLLYRYTGQEDILVGSPIAGRESAALADAVGYFVNPLVLRANLANNPSFTTYLEQIRQQVLSAIEHANYPFMLLAERLQPIRDPSRSPLFQTMFVYQETPRSDEQDLISFALYDTTSHFKLGDLLLDAVEIMHRTAQFDLTLAMAEVNGELHASFEYNTDLFDSATIEQMATHFQILLDGIATDPLQRLSDLPLLSDAERQLRLVEWNATQTDSPIDKTIQELFAAQAAQMPDVVAMLYEDQCLTYRELDQRANQLAHHLRELGIGPDILVGISIDRNLLMVIGILAILKAGGAYVPLDSTYPAERLALMMNDIQTPVLLTQRSLADRLQMAGEHIVCLDEINVGDYPKTVPTNTTTSEHLAYVIYTSGSTGRPKGVAVPHRAVVRLVRDTNYITITPEDRIAQISTISFDAATFELWGALLNGARLVIIPKDITLDVPDFGRKLREQHCSALFITVQLFNLCVSQQPDIFQTVRCVMVGGEAPDLNHIRECLENGPPTRLLNAYGPTENTTFSVCYRIADPLTTENATLPIGYPISNSQAYVLNQQIGLVPTGVIGELYLGGIGLARGYLNSPDTTAEKFVPHPFSTEPGACLYRTGDLVRQRSDGAIEFIGRRDHQVKLRGFRVELGEIEAALRDISEIDDAVVVVREDNTKNKFLVAYVVTKQQTPPSVSVLRGYLKDRLPDYMIPSTFVVLDAFPLSPNGKVDRRLLPVPEEDVRLRLDSRYVPPSTPIEEMLTIIWAEILEVEQVGIEDNFFELGGHSLLATRVISRIRDAFNVDIPLYHIFDSPTIAGLAACIEQIQQAEREIQVPPILLVARQNSMLLSFAQERLWFLEQMGLEQPAYNLPLAIRIKGSLNKEALTASLNEIIRRHDILRTHFMEIEGQPVQVIEDEITLSLRTINLSELSINEQSREAIELLSKEALRPFELAQSPLFRAVLVELGANEHILLLTMHHIVSDGWSIGVLLRELSTLYTAFADGRSAQLPALPIQYIDFAIWQRQWLQGDLLERQLNYWVKQLGGELPTLELPVDHPRSSVSAYRGARLSFILPPELTKALKELSQQEGVTLFMTLLAAFDILLARYSGQDDIVVGSTIANRNRTEVEPLIGFFVNVLVLRTDLTGNPTFSEILQRVRQVTLEAYLYQDTPFEKIVQRLHPEREVGRSPLFQVMFSLQNELLEPMAFHGLSLEPFDLPVTTAKFDLDVDFWERGDELIGSFEYATDLFDSSTIARMQEHYQRLLENIVSQPKARLSELSLISVAEQQQLIQTWTEAAIGENQYCGIQQMFEEQVKQYQNDIAVVYGEEHITYQQLDARANQLAHYLQMLGVGPEIRVGICMDRSIDLVVTVLAVLKAGGAYVPLDPTYPQQRLRYMVEAAQVSVILFPTQSSISLGTEESKTIFLDRDQTLIDREPITAPHFDARPENLAYIIFTSGSTGQPKGVMVSHSSLIAMCYAWKEAYRLRATRLTHLQLTSFSFDVWSGDMIRALCFGGKLVVAPREYLLEPDQLHSLLLKEEVDCIECVPAILRELVNYLRQTTQPFPAIKQVVVGADIWYLWEHQQLQALLPPGTRLYNTYGVTEATIDSTIFEQSTTQLDDIRRILIGRPFTNVHLYVLDRWMQPVPMGVPGELYIGGPVLARGYSNQPDITAERFLPNPFSETPGERIYRTGDHVRYLADGSIEFLGRVDHQIKIHGFRLEPGEIEGALKQHPSIHAAAVTIWEDSPGEKRLIAYIVPELEQILESAELQRFLKEILPPQAIPQVFISLSSLPLTPNGKLDRRALPAPEPGDTAELATLNMPRTSIEYRLASICARILGLEQIGVDADLFELGCHSLMATQIISQIREEFHVSLPLRNFFEEPTIASLAKQITAARMEQYSQSGYAIQRVSRHESLPLSFAQQRLWFLDRLEPGNPFYNTPAAIRIAGRLNVVALEQSLNEIIRRHEVLRTTFEAVDGQPVQHIDSTLSLTIPVIDLSPLEEDERVARIQQIMQDEARRPFNLETGPLIRATLLQSDDEDYLLVFCMHHIVSDGWSINVLIWETSVLYAAFAAGQPSPLLELPIQYSDFASWQRQWLEGPAREYHLDYWMRQLEGCQQVLDLPTDRPRPAIQTYQGAEIAFELPADLVAALRVLSQREQATLFMTLLAAFQVLLYRYSEQEDIIVGSPIANRNFVELEGLIGFFVNMLPLRTNLSGNPTFVELLARVREVTLEAYAHQDLPFEQIVEKLQPERDLVRTPLVQVVCSLDNAPDSSLTLVDLSINQLPIYTGTAMFDLILGLVDRKQALTGSVLYSTDLFEQETILQMIEHFKAILKAVSETPTLPILAIPLWSAGDGTTVLTRSEDEAEQFAF